MLPGFIALLAASVLAQDMPAALPRCPATDPGFVAPDNMVRPRYPKNALRAGTEGVVELKAVISPEGKTKDLSVVSGPPALTRLSLDEVRKWRFHPVLIRSLPVETTYRVKVDFSLTLQQAVPHVELESPPVDPPMPAPTERITSTPAGPVYQVSTDAGIMAPKTIYQVDPEFSEEARRQKESGTVDIELIVGADGLPHDLRPVCADWPSLTEKALEAVRQWRFEPGTKQGKPVQVEIGVEVEFHLD